MSRIILALGSLAVAAAALLIHRTGAQTAASGKVHDLSLLVAPELPCFWSAGMPPVVVNHYERIGPLSPYNSDILVIDEHTATQLDAPAHFVPPPGSPLPGAGEAGLITADKVPAWQFGGEACVIDCADLRDAGKPGISALVTRDRIQAWEKAHRPLGPGDVVVFRSGFDRYYQPLPAGRRYCAEPLAGTAPGWPDPDPECISYLVQQGVRNCATDSPSMGPLPGEVAIATHIAGLRHGMIWTEGARGLDVLPPTGAFYCMIGPNHAGGSGVEGRAFAIAGEPLAGFLIAAARQKQVADISVLLAEDLPVWWPGPGVGNHRQPYYANAFRKITAKNPFFAQTHTLDSHTGTHLVPPAYALPPPGFDNRSYAPQVQKWLAEYEAKYGPRGTSSVTTEQVSLEQTCGWARIVDVGHLVGTTRSQDWPASPEITVADIEKYERQHGALQPGQVVVFRSGHSDRHFKPLPDGDACLANPLNGKSEGWPAPGPETIRYLGGKGVRCVATDGPTLGGAEPKRALWTYWALGSHGMVGVEYLTKLARLPERTYFVFAPVKIKGCHGGPGRALAFF